MNLWLMHGLNFKDFLLEVRISHVQQTNNVPQSHVQTRSAICHSTNQTQHNYWDKDTSTI